MILPALFASCVFAVVGCGGGDEPVVLEYTPEQVADLDAAAGINADGEATAEVELDDI